MRLRSWRRLNRSIVEGLITFVLTFAILGTGIVGLTSASVALPTLVSGPSPFSPGCEAAAQTGTDYLNAEVEPWVDINPTNASNIIGVWQQDRWSNGGSHGLVAGVSHDGGATWHETMAHFSQCAGGNALNGGDYERASDPWISFAPNGDAYQISLSFNDSNPISAVLVSKSATGGDTWSEPVTLIRDTSPHVFNDKESITADPITAGNVYAVWDRLEIPNDRSRGVSFEHAVGFRGPAWFSRTTNGGTSWAPARIIFDPGEIDQTIGNQIVVLPNGDLVDGFDLIVNRKNAQGVRGFNVALIRSPDQGATWSRPIIVSKLEFIPVTDPRTGAAVRTGDIIPEIAADPRSGHSDLYMVWQDARFSGFTHADVAFSRSTDGGLSWSDPIKINKTPSPVLGHPIPAFTPAIRVSSDGTIAVTYYDFRFLGSNTSVLNTDYWIVRCSANCTSSQNWVEDHISGSFDMETAPVAAGFFLGDYEALGNAGVNFRPFFVATNSGNTSNRTDVFTTTVTP